MNQERLFVAFFFVVFAFLLFQLYVFLAGFLAPLVWAGILALTFYPATQRLVRLLGGSRTAAASVLLVAVTVGAILPSIYLGSVLAAQASTVYIHAQEALRTGQASSLVATLRSSPLGGLWEYGAGLLQRFSLDVSDITLRALNWLSAQIVNQATDLARNALSTLLDFLIMLVALFFFFRDGDRMTRSVRSLIPMEPRDRDAVLNRLVETLTATVQGMVVTAATQGVLGGIGYWLIGRLDYSVFLGFLTGLAAFLPIAGPAFVWLAVATALLIAGSTGKAIGIFLWGALVVSGIDNLVKPWLISGKAKLPSFLLLMSLLGGVREYGFLGAFLGPVVLATLLAFVDIYRQAYRLSVAPH